LISVIEYSQQGCSLCGHSWLAEGGVSVVAATTVLHMTRCNIRLISSSCLTWCGSGSQTQRHANKHAFAWVCVCERF